MNSVKGTISHIETQGNLSLVNVLSGEVIFTSIIIEAPDQISYLEIGHEIYIHFKETEVFLGKEPIGQITLRNRIRGNVKNIEKGKLLSEVILETEVGQISSIVTTRAVEELNLKKDEKVVAMIKTNEIMISE